MRGLSPTFEKNLIDNYLLRELLQYVQNDNTMDIEIRENKINIYYRGGSALRIEESKQSEYEFHFDKNYFSSIGLLNEEIIPPIGLKTEWKS